MTLTRSQVRANREKAFTFLQQPELKKGKDCMEHNPEGLNKDSRCCLGHMAVALDVERAVMGGGQVVFGRQQNRHYAPSELVTALGLKNHTGSVSADFDINTSKPLPSGFSSLSNWNDGSDVTPQEIGVYLASVIEGGDGTPLIPLSEYPETVE